MPIKHVYAPPLPGIGAVAYGAGLGQFQQRQGEYNQRERMQVRDLSVRDRWTRMQLAAQTRDRAAQIQAHQQSQQFQRMANLERAQVYGEMDLQRQHEGFQARQALAKQEHELEQLQFGQREQTQLQRFEQTLAHVDDMESSGRWTAEQAEEFRWRVHGQRAGVTVAGMPKAEAQQMEMAERQEYLDSIAEVDPDTGRKIGYTWVSPDTGEPKFIDLPQPEGNVGLSAPDAAAKRMEIDTDFQKRVDTDVARAQKYHSWAQDAAKARHEAANAQREAEWNEKKAAHDTQQAKLKPKDKIPYREAPLPQQFVPEPFDFQAAEDEARERYAPMMHEQLAANGLMESEAEGAPPAPSDPLVEPQQSQQPEPQTTITKPSDLTPGEVYGPIAAADGKQYMCRWDGKQFIPVAPWEGGPSQ